MMHGLVSFLDGLFSYIHHSMIQSWGKFFFFGWVPWPVGIHVSSSSTQSEQHPVTNTYATNKAPTTFQP